MSAELRELYQSTILDHNREPRNFRVPATPSHRADGYNPLCGDRVTIYLTLDGDGAIEDVAFQGSGCAISTASASLMTQALKGLGRAEALALFDNFHELLTGAPDSSPQDIGKLAVFAGVREFPMRVKCATLAWHAFRSAIEGRSETAKTE